MHLCLPRGGRRLETIRRIHNILGRYLDHTYLLFPLVCSYSTWRYSWILRAKRRAHWRRVFQSWACPSATSCSVSYPLLGCGISGVSEIFVNLDTRGCLYTLHSCSALCLLTSRRLSLLRAALVSVGDFQRHQLQYRS